MSDEQEYPVTVTISLEQAAALYGFLGDFFMQAKPWNEPPGWRYGSLMLGQQDALALNELMAQIDPVVEAASEAGLLGGGKDEDSTETD